MSPMSPRSKSRTRAPRARAAAAAATAKSATTVFPPNATPPDAHGFPHYAAIGRANAAHRQHYEQTLADRRAAAVRFRASASPVAWRRHARDTRAQLAANLGVRVHPVADPVSPPVFVRATTLMPDQVTTTGPSVFPAAAVVATIFNLPAAGLDGGDIELLTLRCPAVGGPYPTLLWLPRAGDCYTGAQSPLSAAREFGHTLAAAGWLVVIPRLPAFENLSIIASKRRLLEGTSALGAILAEAARTVPAIAGFPGRDEAAGLWVGGADVGGLTALFLAALDSRIRGVAACELPRLTGSTVHEALIVPRINATADLATIACLCAPAAVVLDATQSLCPLAPIAAHFRRRKLAAQFIACDSGSQVIERLARLRTHPLPASRAKAATSATTDSRAGCVGAPLPPRRQFDITRGVNQRAALANWPKRQAELRRQYHDLLGIPPPQLPLQVQKIGTTELADCTRVEYHVTTEPDCIINLTWLTPHDGKKARAGSSRRTSASSAAAAATQPQPVVLCLPGSGSDVAKVEKHYAHEIIARGWQAVIMDARVALYPFHPGIAERRAMIAQSIHDLLTATQWVFAQPGVDVRRVACMGVSQGGTHSWMLPALEPRIVAAAPVCGVCTFQSLIDNVRDERYDSVWRSFLDSHSIYYFVPGSLDRFEQQDLCALVAPRHFALIGADHDNCFPLDGMREAARDLSAFYRLLGKPNAFRYVEFAGEHSIPLHSREAAYNFIAGAYRAAGR